MVFNNVVRDFFYFIFYKIIVTNYNLKLKFKTELIKYNFELKLDMTMLLNLKV